jgi:hypothetical protein
MDSLGNALRAASGAPAPRAAGATGASGDPDTPSTALVPLEPALVLGAGGRLGSALLAEALAAGRFAAVRAWVAAPLTSTLRGLRPLTEAQFAGPGSLHANVAFIVFERERFSNGRDEAFVMPQPERLPAIAQRLHEGGVRRLLIVLPHASSMLPQALAEGLATRDEAAVAALGFEQLVLLKPSQDIKAQRADGHLERFAQWWLSQLRWMVPQREMPLRAAALARLTVMLARALPRAAPGTYVVPQSLLWQLAQDADGGELRLAAWLQAAAPPPAAALPGPAR